MTSILHFDQQLWPQSPVSLYHPLSPPITPFAPLFWTFRPHVSISSKCQPFYRYSLDFPVSRLFMIPCFQKNIPLQTAICILPNVHLGDALHSHLVLPKSFHRYHSSIFLTDHTFECSIFKPETLVGLSPSESLTTT